MAKDEKNEMTLCAGLYRVGHSIEEGEYDLYYLEKSGFTELKIETKDYSYATISLTKDNPRVHLSLENHRSFIIDKEVGIKKSRQGMLFSKTNSSSDEERG